MCTIGIEIGIEIGIGIGIEWYVCARPSVLSGASLVPSSVPRLYAKIGVASVGGLVALTLLKSIFNTLATLLVSPPGHSHLALPTRRVRICSLCFGWKCS